MRHNQFDLPPASVQASAVALLINVLGLIPRGPRLPAHLLARVLLWVGLKRATFTAAAAPRSRGRRHGAVFRAGP